MKILNKDIIKNNKCIVCGHECNEGKITILGNCICKECIDKITFMNMDNPQYYKIKDKIKNKLIKNL
ncbi:MAG: hypothetical protein MJ191_05620 [Clostridium sp.]|nr:hypothetical protein [Clostridium sp.]